jgi:hypothetical protein
MLPDRPDISNVPVSRMDLYRMTRREIGALLEKLAEWEREELKVVMQ